MLACVVCVLSLSGERIRSLDLTSDVLVHRMVGRSSFPLSDTNDVIESRLFEGKLTTIQLRSELLEGIEEFAAPETAREPHLYFRERIQERGQSLATGCTHCKDEKCWAPCNAALNQDDSRHYFDDGTPRWRGSPHEGRVLLQEFRGLVAANVAQHEVQVHEYLLEQSLALGETSPTASGGRPELAYVVTLLGSLVAPAAVEMEPFQSQWETLMPPVPLPQKNNRWLLYRWEGLLTAAKFPLVRQYGERVAERDMLQSRLEQLKVPAAIRRQVDGPSNPPVAESGAESAAGASGSTETAARGTARGVNSPPSSGGPSSRGEMSSSRSSRSRVSESYLAGRALFVRAICERSLRALGCFFRPTTHFSHMSHPTFPISRLLFLFFNYRALSDGASVVVATPGRSSLP